MESSHNLAVDVDKLYHLVHGGDAFNRVGTSGCIVA